MDQKTEQVRAAALEKLRTKKIKIDEEDLAKSKDSSEDVGIKEIKELIIFVFSMAEVTIEVVGDGIGLLDIIDVFRADDVRKEFGPAVSGADEIPQEVTDLSTQEMKELADLIWEEAWNLWNAISQ